MKWQSVKLGEVADFVNGAAFKPEDWGTEGRKIIRIQNLTGQSSIYNRTHRKVPGKFTVRNGDLLVSWSATLGVYEWRDSEESLLNQHIFKVVINESKVDKYYLKRALEVFIVSMSQFTHGSTMKHINRGEFLATEIPLPPLPEQERIAALLDAADRLRAQRRDALKRLDALTHALFLDTFGDPAHNPKNWPVVKLGEIGKISTGSTPPSVLEGMFGGDIPFLTPGDLDINAPIKRTVTASGAAKSRMVRAGSTMVCCIGTIGKMRKVSVRSAFNQQINAVEWFDSVNDEYGFQALQFTKETMKSSSPSTTLPILKKSLFEQIEIPLPSLSLQQEFATRLEQIEGLRGRMERSALELDALFGSLQSAAFGGE